MRNLLAGLTWPIRSAYGGLVWVANSPRALLGSYFVFLVIGGTLYSYFEDKTFGESVWWAVVTASTVGYGDTYPKSTPGRFVAGTLICLMVLIVIPLITAHFASKLIVDQDAFRHEEQEEIKQNLRRIRLLAEELATRVGVAVPADAASGGVPGGAGVTGGGVPGGAAGAGAPPGVGAAGQGGATGAFSRPGSAAPAPAPSGRRDKSRPPW